MNHFPPSVWVDSVRGLLPSGPDSEVRSHLDKQCPECMGAHAFWARLNNILRQEVRYRPPEEVLLESERLFAPHEPWRWLKTAAHWAELLFDSLQQPSVVFVRGMPASERHLVYQASPFVIDVRLKTNGNGNNLSLAGQILRTDADSESNDVIYVVLLSGGELIAKTLASQGGEFALECELRQDLSLFISVRGERAIGISVSESMPPQLVPA